MYGIGAAISVEPNLGLLENPVARGSQGIVAIPSVFGQPFRECSTALGGRTQRSRELKRIINP